MTMKEVIVTLPRLATAKEMSEALGFSSQGLRTGQDRAIARHPPGPRHEVRPPRGGRVAGRWAQSLL